MRELGATSRPIAFNRQRNYHDESVTKLFGIGPTLGKETRPDYTLLLVTSQLDRVT